MFANSNFLVLRRPVEAALRSAIRMMNEAATLARALLTDGLVQRIQHKAGCHVGGNPPAYDLSGKDIYDECDIGHASYQA